MKSYKLLLETHHVVRSDVQLTHLLELENPLAVQQYLSLLLLIHMLVTVDRMGL
jgi:hypothetical protein